MPDRPPRARPWSAERGHAERLPCEFRVGDREHETGEGEAARLDLALDQFRRRPPMSTLPTGLQRDIRPFFGSYANGCRLADGLLFRAGDAGMFDDACRRSAVDNSCLSEGRGVRREGGPTGCGTSLCPPRTSVDAVPGGSADRETHHGSPR